MSKHYDVVIIGGGIVGLATARALLQNGVRHVAVLEAEAAIATHQTGRNSGVIHSGLYYKPGSSKAENCRAGRDAMYRFCEENGIPFRRSGKIIVATRESELPRLRDLQQRGIANGLSDLRLLSRDELRELEPEVDAIAGMAVREAGIVDYGAVARAFADQIRAAGGEIFTSAAVRAVRTRSGKHEVEHAAGDLTAALLVNCAGLQCDRVARLCGVDPEVAIIPFRGEYYDLVPSARSLVRNPIYPVPDPAFPFLGVHLTPTIHGKVEAGPNAVLAFKREGYRKRDFSLRDTLTTLSYPGFIRLAGRHWSYGWSEMARSFSKRLFLKSLQALVPRLQESDIVPGKAGVRAQAVDRNGKLLDDFYIVEGPGSIHVLNAPSPAATASISIGQSIAAMCAKAGIQPRTQVAVSN